MRILTFKPNQGVILPFMIQDCIDAFEELGHEIKCIHLEGYGDWRIEFKEILREELESFCPDLVFTMLSYDKETENLLASKKTPHAFWIMEKEAFPFIGPEWISPYCLLFVWDKFYTEELRRMGFKKVFYLLSATNPKRFMEINDDELKRYACDISFVGYSMYPAYRDYYQGEGEFKFKDKKMLQILQETITIQAQNPFLKTEDILTKVQEAHQYFYLPIQNQDEIPILLYHIENAASSLHRKEMIEEIFSLNLHLFGDKGWLYLLNRGKNINFFGMISYTKTPFIYKASKINLNINAIKDKTGLGRMATGINHVF